MQPEAMPAQFDVRLLLNWKVPEPAKPIYGVEITVVLKGMLRVEHEGGTLDVRPGQAIVTSPGEWVRYSTPDPDGAHYVAVCVPAFSMETVKRDE